MSLHNPLVVPVQMSKQSGEVSGVALMGDQSANTNAMPRR